MPISVEEPRTAGWWVKRLFNRLTDRKRQRRLKLLYDHHCGEAPLPEGARNAREAYADFQRKARSNFAELIVSAVSERMTPVGFRSAVDEDVTGDAEIGALWQRAGLEVESNNVHDLMLSLSESYVIVGDLDEETQAPVITAEDPRWMVGEPDPARPRRLLAALKLLHDDVDGQDRIYLYLPGQVRVAVRRAKSVVARTPLMSFSPNGWDWDEERSGELAHNRIPVVRFFNKDGLGEYESHIDLLGRINHQILQRMIIATLQAFRQRAVKGLPLKDERGNLIDYTDVFSMDPAALWQLPTTAEMWESGQVDLTPILNAVKDDVQHLGAVTRTPLYMLLPAGDNQSAEGASLQREGLVFKTRDRISRCSNPWAQVMSLALLQTGQSDRADLSKLQTIWAPPEHLSLAERADAAVKAGKDIPRRSRLIHIWGFSPADADRMMSEWTDEALLATQLEAAVPPNAASTQAGPQPASETEQPPNQPPQQNA